MNNQSFPFNLFPNGIPPNNNQTPNPFLNMMQNSPLMNFSQPNNLFSNLVDKNMVDSVFANIITTDFFPIKLDEPERILDTLLFLSEKTFLSRLNSTNRIEFEEFIKMFRTSDNSKPERKLALFLNLLNYYTKKQNIAVNEEEMVANIDDFEPEIEPVD